MSDSKEAQAARHEVDRQLREENRERYETLMHEAFAKRGMQWAPRRTAETRAAIKAAEAKAKAARKIEEIAAKAGITVDIGDLGVAVHVVNAIGATFDGTAETVTGNWHGDQDGFADEAPAEA